MKDIVKRCLIDTIEHGITVPRRACLLRQEVVASVYSNRKTSIQRGKTEQRMRNLPCVVEQDGDILFTFPNLLCKPKRFRLNHLALSTNA